jgi:hypothetical protein
VAVTDTALIAPEVVNDATVAGPLLLMPLVPDPMNSPLTMEPVKELAVNAPALEKLPVVMAALVVKTAVPQRMDSALKF